MNVAFGLRPLILLRSGKAHLDDTPRIPQNACATPSLRAIQSSASEMYSCGRKRALPPSDERASVTRLRQPQAAVAQPAH